MYIPADAIVAFFVGVVLAVLVLATVDAVYHLGRRDERNGIERRK